MACIWRNTNEKKRLEPHHVADYLDSNLQKSPNPFLIPPSDKGPLPQPPARSAMKMGQAPPLCRTTPSPRKPSPTTQSAAYLLDNQALTTHQRATEAHRARELKKNRRGACILTIQFVYLPIVNLKSPVNKLTFKTANVQGQNRQPNFQNLSIRVLSDSCGFWSCAFISYLHNGAFG